MVISSRAWQRCTGLPSHQPLWTHYASYGGLFQVGHHPHSSRMGVGNASFPYTTIVALVTPGSRRQLYWLTSKGGGNNVDSKDLPTWRGLKTVPSTIYVTL